MKEFLIKARIIPFTATVLSLLGMLAVVGRARFLDLGQIGYCPTIEISSTLGISWTLTIPSTLGIPWTIGLHWALQIFW